MFNYLPLDNLDSISFFLLQGPLLFLMLILTLFVLSVVWTLKNGISPMPTSLKVKKVLMDHLPEVAQGTIYELGSGWGSLALPLSQKYPQCSVIAIENSPLPYFISKIRMLFSKDKNLQIYRKNFYHLNLHDAAMIVCYLYPGAMQKLKTKFEHELKKGTIIVSHTFAVPGWKAHKIYEVPDIYRTKIYLYYL